MLLMGKQIRTRLDLLVPSVDDNVIENQPKMIKGGKTRYFYIGDNVYILNFSKNAKEHKWLSAVIVSKPGPLTYIVELPNGRLFKRHVDHIRARSVYFSCTSVSMPY